MSALSDHCPACGQEYADVELEDSGGHTPCCLEPPCPEWTLDNAFLADGWVRAWDGDVIRACCPAVADNIASEFGRRIAVRM